MPGLILFALASLMSAAHPMRAPNIGPTGFALYSDACINVPSGDLLGERIGILRLNRGYETYFFYQEAEGEWQEPQIVKLHRSEGDPIRSKISFAVRWGGDEKDTFNGTVTDKMIIGEFENPRHTNGFDQRQFRLPRVLLDQKGYPYCN